MHFHGLAERLLGSRSRIAILKALLRGPDVEWTGREIAREAGLSPTQALAALRVFESEGLCHQRRIGKASVWRADPDHFVVKALEPVMQLDQVAQRRLEETILASLEGSGALEAFLFGSNVKGTEEASSDVDLLVVFPDQGRATAWKAQLEGLRSAVQKQFSSFLSPVVYTRAETRRPGARRLLIEARRTGALLEVGK